MSHSPDNINPSRRAFLANGSLIMAFSLLPLSFKAMAGSEEMDTLGTAILDPNLPGSLRSNPYLDAWVRIDPDNHITVFTGKVELGTGVKTALLQIAADRLDVPPQQIDFITADTGLTPNEGYTAGSHSIFDSGTALFNAAAQVRQLLLMAAAKLWKAPLASLRTGKGTISDDTGRQMTYGQAVAGVDLHQVASEHTPSKDPKDYTEIGRSLPRVDIPAKVSGGVAYVQDMRLPGMLHARVIRPPRRGSRLKAIDVEAVEKLPGVVKLVKNGSYLAVVAKDEWQAISAMKAGYLASQWGEGNSLPEPTTIFNLLQTLPQKRYPIADKGTPGTAGSGPAYSGRQTRQYLMHGSIGPSCAVAWFKDGLLTVWTHTQGVFPLRAGLAELVGLPAKQIRCIHKEGAGCYGHNGADDVAADAALIAMALPGQPVRVQWMREDENLWEPYSSAMLTELKASLDGNGKIADWGYTLWSTPHNERIVNAGRLLPAWLLEHPIAPAPPVPIPRPEGDGDRNSVPAYDIPSLKVDFNFVTTMPFRTSAMRSLGAHINVFSIESAIDELAEKASVDPVAFRLQHLSDPRAVAVVNKAAQAFGWPGKVTQPGQGYGFAFARYKNIMGYCAIAVEVQVQRQTGEVSIVRVVTAVDVGQVVSPDGLINQVQGGIVQSSSWSLYEQVLYDKQGVHSFDWSGYPILRFPQMPLQVDVHIINQPGEPFLGAAEIVQGPMAAALGNAISHAVAKRQLHLPMAREGWQGSLY